MTALAILLNDQPVGELTLHPDEISEFRTLDEYRQLTRRPVLGQAFEDDLGKRHRSRMSLPPFFSNLLPEGPLRQLIAKRHKVSPARELFLLAQLGADLPGAVRALPSADLEHPGVANESPVPSPTHPLKFSLAGVQLKLSMIREGRGLTLPMRGVGGDWIVKLPDSRYRGVPENELVTMTWAKAAGLSVADVELVDVKALGGLPREIQLDPSAKALAVKRFDRVDGRRVHLEDFAQVLNVYSAEKYGATNYETLGRLILRIAGDSHFDEFVRRLAFIIVSGNADAHLKNWSFLYPDGVTAELSPAYDLVSTVEFLPHDELALNLGRTKEWSALSVGRFASFARRVGVDEGRVERLVRETTERAMAAWRDLERELPVSEALGTALTTHWSKLALP